MTEIIGTLIFLLCLFSCNHWSNRALVLLITLPLTVYSQTTRVLNTDRWDWVLEPSSRVMPHSLQMYRLSDGNVLVVYELRHPHVEKHELVKKLLGNTSSKAGRPVEDVGISDDGHVDFGGGKQLKIVQKADTSIHLADGTKIVSVDRRLLNIACFRGPFPHVFNRYYDNSVDQFAVMRILPRPKRFSVVNREDGGRCPDELSQTFTYRVETVQGLMLPVGPDMFLLEVEPGVLIRFRSNFDTETSFLNKNYFVWNLDRMANRVARLEEADSYQKMMDRLLNYLSDKNKGERRGN